MAAVPDDATNADPSMVSLLIGLVTATVAGAVFLGSARGVLERVRELTLPPRNRKEASGYLRQLLESTGHVLYSYDSGTGRYEYVSDSVADLLGWSAADFRRRGPLDLLDEAHPDDRDALAACLDEARARSGAAPVPVEWEYRRRTRSGTYLWIREAGTLHPGPDGEPWRVVAVMENISARKATETAAHENEELFRQAFEYAPVGSALLSPDGAFLKANATLCQILGYNREALQELGYLDIVHPEEREQLQMETERLLAGKGEHSTHEIRCQHSAGRTLRIRLSLSVARNAEGRPHRLVCQMEDVTDRRLLEEQLRHAEKMQAIGELAGGIAHDFNNQLVGVLGFAEVLQSALTQPRLKGYVASIEESATRAAELTGHLLSFARKRRPRTKTTDLNRIIREVNALLRHTVDKRIRIQKSLSNEPAVIECDATLVQNALLNLGLNARDALPDGGTIRLQTEIVSLDSNAPESYLDDFRPGRYVRVRVSDDGLGMDEVTRQRIFEPFFTTKPSGQGTGMGLSSVYGTVKSHRGFLDVQSESRRGTVFTLYFPLAKAALPATPLDPIIPDPVYGDGARVLVVDDEPAVCKTARTMLEDLGYRVTVCSNGEEAIRYFRRHYRRVDAVLLDLVMPCMGGRETLQELRRIQRNVRVVIASGYADADEEMDLRKLGAAAFLPKPFRRNDLADRLAEALERKDPVPVRR